MLNPNLFPVADVMTSNPICLDAQETLLAVKDIFERENIHHIIVTKEGRLAGILSKTDFLGASHLIGYLKTQKNEEYNEKFYQTLLVEDIMSTPVWSVEPTDRLDKVVDLFRTNRIHAVPVVNKAVGIPIGIITTYDLIFQAYDNAIRRIESF
jgi:CBS domain-containing protein